ncbi:MAG TPA: hypothetical protein VKM54_14975 [Myxococcota bacterium]|nr:hypothetical protein [Myxococcota bacterium]
MEERCDTGLELVRHGQKRRHLFARPGLGFGRFMCCYAFHPSHQLTEPRSRIPRDLSLAVRNREHALERREMATDRRGREARVELRAYVPQEVLLAQLVQVPRA